MKQYRIAISVFLIVFQGITAQAEDMNFQTIWKLISDKSHVQKATQLESDAVKEAKNRSARHWLPRLYLDVKGYQTSDPGSSFIGLLEQRAVTQTDFDLDAINHPDQHFYTRGALGLDFPLYEGGMKVAEYRMQNHFSNSKEQEIIKIRNEQYAEVAKTFGALAVIDQQKNKLSEMNNTLARLLKGYKLGIRSNPVGYSGLLGLRSLSNRLQGLLKQYGLQSEALYLALKEMGLEKNSDWRPQFEDVTKFTKKFLTVNKLEESSAARSVKEKAMASKEASQMGKARFLPKIGAFAETYAFSGSRATANGYTAGLYLQWNLFSPSDYGTLKESKLHTAAADYYAQAYAEKERAEFHSLQKTSESLLANIELLSDSEKIMTEQVQVTENLFKNGSVNALQFVEVLSRRVDLISSQTEAQMSLIKTDAEKILKTHFVIPLEGNAL